MIEFPHKSSALARVASQPMTAQRRRPGDSGAEMFATLLVKSDKPPEPDGRNEHKDRPDDAQTELAPSPMSIPTIAPISIQPALRAAPMLRVSKEFSGAFDVMQAGSSQDRGAQLSSIAASEAGVAQPLVVAALRGSAAKGAAAIEQQEPLLSGADMLSAESISPGAEHALTPNQSVAALKAEHAAPDQLKISGHPAHIENAPKAMTLEPSSVAKMLDHMRSDVVGRDIAPNDVATPAAPSEANLRLSLSMFETHFAPIVSNALATTGAASTEATLSVQPSAPQNEQSLAQVKVIEIALEPEALGALTAKIHVSAKHLRIEIEVNSADAYDALSRIKEQLSDALNATDYVIDGLNLNVRPTQQLAQSAPIAQTTDSSASAFSSGEFCAHDHAKDRSDRALITPAKDTQRNAPRAPSSGSLGAVDLYL